LQIAVDIDMNTLLWSAYKVSSNWKCWGETVLIATSDNNAAKQCIHSAW